MSISFEELLRRNLVPNVEIEIDLLQLHELETDWRTFVEREADLSGNINNMMSDDALTGLFVRIGFSNQAAHILAIEVIRRFSFTRN